MQFGIDSLGLARICPRLLNGMPFNFRTSGWTGLDLGIFHEHIFFDDGTNIGFTTTGPFSETDPKIIAKYKCLGKHFMLYPIIAKILLLMPKKLTKTLNNLGLKNEFFYKKTV